MPPNKWISSLLLLPPIPPSIRVFSNESTLRMRWPKYWSFSFSIIPSKEIQGWSPSEWTGWISLGPRDSQESSPTPQFKSINSLALSLLHSPALTSIHDLNQVCSFLWLIFHCIYISQLLYPFICWWTSRLLSCPTIVNISKGVLKK